MAFRSNLAASGTKSWPRGARKLLERYRPRFRDRRFWIAQGLVIGIAVVHDLIEIEGYLPHLEALYFVPVSLFFIPVMYAALNFGLSGAIATASWAVIITTPNWVFWHQGQERFGVIFQMAVLVAAAVFVGLWVDREMRARRQAESAGAALKIYAGHVLRAQEEERQRIAREIHDDTIQNLILVCRRLSAVESTGESLSPSATEDLREARKTAEQLVGGLRDYARALRPPVLDDLGVVASIRRLLEDFMERSGTQGQLNIVGEPQRLAQEAEIGLFRVAQEALWNAERHSKSTEVTVTLSFTEHEVGLTVQDNGVGFNVPPMLEELSVGGQLGLLGMQERAELLGGRLKLQSRPGSGTTVIVSCPIGPV